jgi:hypothetical protein
MTQVSGDPSEPFLPSDRSSPRLLKLGLSFTFVDDRQAGVGQTGAC